ncbi:MAG: hypothetical protein FWC95_02195 [Defluviitaleaceae bacterium]|nr:hypothetical protein [Defluviitaleaceae bacterium]
MAQAARQQKYDDAYLRYLGGASIPAPSISKNSPRSTYAQMPLSQAKPAIRGNAVKKTSINAMPEPNAVSKTVIALPFSVIIIRSVGALFILSLLLLAVFASYHVSSMQREFNELQNSLTRLTRDNIALRGEINASHDLVEIESFATQVLGMALPASHQIILIPEIAGDFTTRHDLGWQTEQESSLWQNIIRMFRGFIRSEG